MTDPAHQQRVVPIPMPRRGVNLYSNVVNLHPEEATQTRNLVVRGGLRKRGGSTKFETDEVSTGDAITGLTKFYYSSSSSEVIASSGTVVRKHNGTTWADIKTGLTDGLQTHMTTWGPLNKLYIANGTDTPFSWDGSSATNLSGTNFPSQALQFLPYRDRLLHIDNNQLGFLGWSFSYDDTKWESLTNIGVRVDSKILGMVLHSEGNDNAGLDAKVLLAGTTDMHLFSGVNLSPVISDFKLDSLGINVGCRAIRTMQWTPKGTMWLGNDGMVYLLPFNSSRAIPIGHKIKANQVGKNGTESISGSLMGDACAAYQDGFYMLSFASGGASVNNTQYWLDLENLYQDENGHFGPWYGPMDNQNISVFAVLNGTNDTGGLLGGEASASTGSFVYNLNQIATYSDIENAISVRWDSSPQPLGDRFLMKQTDKMEFDLLDNDDAVTVDYKDSNRTLGLTNNILISSTRVKYGQQKYSAFKYNSASLVRAQLDVLPEILFRMLSIVVKNTSSSDDFQLFSVGVQVIERDLNFEDAVPGTSSARTKSVYIL